MRENRIPTMVETGGPCSGKSTGLSLLRQKLRDFGVSVIAVPEAATLVFGSGVRPQDVLSDPDRNRAFQRQLVLTQIANEDNWREFARITSGEKKLIVCDRGLMDNAAYIGHEAYEEILFELGITVPQARDERYDLICHLVSAADGAEEHYNFDNPERIETPEQARDLDRRTLEAWVGHRSLRIIPNVEKIADGTMRRVPFEQKMERLLAEACRLLDLPVPLNVQRKFLLSEVPQASDFPVRVTTTLIEQVYLPESGDGIERRIRRLTPCGPDAGAGVLHVHTEKREVRPGVRAPVRERIISRREYETLKLARDLSASTIRKVRMAFAWNHQYFHLDVFQAPGELALLEVDLTEAHNDVDLPPFLKVTREVTEDADYMNASLARSGGTRR